MTVQWALTVFLVFILAIGLLLLVMPVRLTLLAETHPKWRARVELALFGGWLPNLGIYDTSTRRKRKPGVAKKPETDGKSGKRRSIAPGAWVGLVREILRRIRFEHLRVDAKVGFDDPADTGAFYGMLSPLVYGLGSGRAEIDLEPDFQNAGFDARIDTAIEVRPVALIPPLWQFAWRAFARRS
ncbi:MAG: DUF2953 domain-containing protein [Pseudomonadota bacterium]